MIREVQQSPPSRSAGALALEGRLNRASGTARVHAAARQRLPATEAFRHHQRHRRYPFSAVQFTKYLRDGVRSGAITSTVRIWTSPHVKAGHRYRMEEGEIEVESILPITLADITPEIARASGFASVADLLKVAKHGPGENVYLIRFHYIPPSRSGPSPGSRPSSKKPVRRR